MSGPNNLIRALSIVDVRRPERVEKLFLFRDSLSRGGHSEGSVQLLSAKAPQLKKTDSQQRRTQCPPECRSGSGYGSGNRRRVHFDKQVLRFKELALNRNIVQL